MSTVTVVALILATTVIRAWHFGGFAAEEAKTAFISSAAKQTEWTGNTFCGLTSQPVCVSIAGVTSAEARDDVGPVVLIGQRSQTYLTWDPIDGLRRWPMGAYLTHSVSDDARHW